MTFLLRSQASAAAELLQSQQGLLKLTGSLEATQRQEYLRMIDILVSWR